MLTDTNTEQAATLKAVAHAHVQALNYTDESVRRLAVELEITRKRHEHHLESRKLREKFIERVVFVLIGAVVALCLDRLRVSHVVLAGVAVMPEIGRECVELIRRI